jgi:hypothetical protein
MRREATCPDDARAMKIFSRERRADFVMPGRNPQRLVLVDAGSPVRRARRTEAMVERHLQRGGVIGRTVPGRAKTAVLHTHGIEIGKKKHWSRHHQAAVVSAVHAVAPSVLM